MATGGGDSNTTSSNSAFTVKELAGDSWWGSGMGVTFTEAGPSRSLRSNTKPTEGGERLEQPPPPEFADKYFFKDFGVHGIYVGICMSWCKNGHKNGRDDIYRVQYDDGDVESLQYRDIRKMLKKAPADLEAWKNAEAKREEVLEALKKNEPAKHKHNTESARNSTKISEESSNGTSKSGEEEGVMEASSNGDSKETGEKIGKGNTDSNPKECSEKKDGKAKINSISVALTTKPATPKKTEATRSPKSPNKAQDKKAKKLVVHRKRKAPSALVKSTTAPDEPESTKRQKVKIECTHPGFGWLEHRPCQISRILARRSKTIFEYEVEWAGRGCDRTWEPAQNIHSQLVNDFDRISEAHAAKLKAAQEYGSAAVTSNASYGSTVHVPSHATNTASKVEGKLRKTNGTQNGTLPVSMTPVGVSQQQQIGQMYHTVNANGHCQHPLCQQQMLVDSYRSVLKFMEPPGWAESGQRVDAYADSALSSFPITAFLEYYGHTIQEMMQVRDARVQLAEVKLAEAEHRAIAAEAQVELLVATAREKH